MQTSIIKDALSSPDSLHLFWKEIAGEVQQYERKSSKKGSVCHIVLDEDTEFEDLGDGKLSEDSGPLSGDFSGSFDNNLALMFDFQTRF